MDLVVVVCCIPRKYKVMTTKPDQGWEVFWGVRMTAFVAMCHPQRHALDDQHVSSLVLLALRKPFWTMQETGPHNSSEPKRWEIRGRGSWHLMRGAKSSVQPVALLTLTFSGKSSATYPFYSSVEMSQSPTVCSLVFDGTCWKDSHTHTMTSRTSFRRRPLT